jgi:hypothetical protein
MHIAQTSQHVQIGSRYGTHPMLAAILSGDYVLGFLQ